MHKLLLPSVAAQAAASHISESGSAYMPGPSCMLERLAWYVSEEALVEVLLARAAGSTSIDPALNPT